MNSNQSIVSFKNVCMYFGGVKAIDDITFEVEKGKIFGIIGPNGAGKSTLFNVLTGVYTPTSGEIYYGDTLINKLEPHVIISRGIARTFQNIKLFNSETVLDNMKVAQASHIQYGITDALLQTKRYRREEKRIETECMEILGHIGLADYAGHIAGALPYGIQRKVEIARALCCKPDLLLLDEPAAGMNPAEVDDLNRLIVDLRDHYQLTILVVEHQMRLVMSICAEVLVINFGKKLLQGKPEEIKNDPQVLTAYLGKAR